MVPAAFGAGAHAEHLSSEAQGCSMRTPTMTRIVARTGRSTLSGTRALRWLPKKMPGSEPMTSEPQRPNGKGHDPSPLKLVDDQGTPSTHAQCVSLADLKSRWDDGSVAAAVGRVVEAALHAPDAPKLPGPGGSKRALDDVAGLDRTARAGDRNHPKSPAAG